MQLQQVTRAAANFLAQPDGPAVAMFDTTGWDSTYTGQPLAGPEAQAAPITAAPSMAK